MLKTASPSKILIILFHALLFSCKQNSEKLPYYNSPDFTPIFIENQSEIPERITHKIAPFRFTNHEGQIFTEKNLEGKIHVANFFFTSCSSICPRITQNLQKAATNFENDSNILFLSYSVTPWADSVPKLREYREIYEITNHSWHFLTGDKAEIYQLARTSYFAEEDIGFSRDSSEFLHTEHILLVDPSLHIRGIYNGTLKTDISRLIEDIETLKRQSN